MTYWWVEVAVVVVHLRLNDKRIRWLLGLDYPLTWYYYHFGRVLKGNLPLSDQRTCNGDIVSEVEVIGIL